MYHRSAQITSGGRRANRGTRRSGRRSTPGQERARLGQLLICLALFLAVFIGKGVFPQKLVQAREDLLTVLSTNTDFQGAFARLGESLAGQGDLLGVLGQFCVEVFGGTEEPAQPVSKPDTPIPELTSLLRSEQRYLSEERDGQDLAEHFMPGESRQLLLSRCPQPVQPPPDAVPAQPAQAVPAVGTVILTADYKGDPPPSRYTMDQLSLGGLETVTPVLGWVTSPYGYRDHPISGKYQFHGGVDIGGSTGDPIHAFAAGTVEYVGKNDSYGLYFQLDHGNGIKSFYAHCDTVLARKGQSVAMGEVIAQVGSSGTATGPHLHLELKYGDIRMDPAYYIDTLTAQ